MEYFEDINVFAAFQLWETKDGEKGEELFALSDNFLEISDFINEQNSGIYRICAANEELKKKFLNESSNKKGGVNDTR